MVQDGRFLVELSPDGMLAKGTFVPAVGEGRELVLGDVDYELRAAGVTHGIDWDLVNRMIQKCREEKQIVRDIVIARGSHSRPGVPACPIFHPAIQTLGAVFLPPEKLSTMSEEEQRHVHANAVKLDALGNVDYRESQALFIIHEGQLLARDRDAIQGIPGTTVQGGYVPFAILKANPMEPGMNVEAREGKYYAVKNGRFAWNGRSFWVEETLELAEEVGYKTGNIRFPGNLILKAGVKDRFKVWVGGNLAVGAVLDAYEVFCGGSLEAKSGIIGRSKGLVRVKGDLITRFAEHCDIEVLGNISLEIASLNSQIYCLGELKTSEKGRIVGGLCMARQGIVANSLGNASGAETVVCAGANYVMHRKLDYSKEKFQQIQTTLDKVKERLQKTPDQSLQLQANRLREEADKYREMMAEVMGQINDNDQATITVSGQVYPGVIIDICGARLDISKPMKAVKFHLDHASGKILIDNTTQKSPQGHS